MSFEYTSPQPRDHDLRRILMTSFGLVLLLVVATLSSTTSMVNNASGQGAQEETAEQKNTKLVRQFLSAIETGNVGNASQFISPQFINDPGAPIDPAKARLRGPQAFINTVNSVREGFPDFRRQAQQIIAQGDMVIVITNLTGTHTGYFFTLPPTGKKVSWESIHIFRIGEDGKIAKHRVIRSGPAFWAQLGVIGPALPKYEPFFRALVGGGVTNSSR